MKTEWDYTSLADAYLKRPDYADKAIDAMLTLSELKQDAKICDIGAGVGHLTLMLSNRGYQVHAIEPNDAMRANGSQRTKNKTNVIWSEGTGENTGLSNQEFNLVTFGSSFNVVDRAKALLEVKRITKPKAWFACMWNHRDIEDPIQKAIENIIAFYVPDYHYGLRRENQTQFLKTTQLFDKITIIEEKIIHHQSIEDCVEAWRSHGTLHRQAKENFSDIINEIDQYLKKETTETIPIPYVTKIWAAQFID